ncbi:MAG: type II toxin-antitoxin system HicB family antitoxin [bacterium]|nr:type II toxin-antitoxin system HicB family antitoxin [bacterium]
MKSQNFHYTIIMRPETEGGFTVTVPALPGCVTYGRNLKEARAMAEDAISGYIVSMKKHGEPIPTDSQSFVASIDLMLPARYASKAS